MRAATRCISLIAIALMDAVPIHAETFRVTIEKLDFSPKTISAHVGDTVEWVNNDIVMHSATVRGDWDVVVAPHQTASLTLKKPGDVEYFCRFHPNMKGHLTVAK